jgi:hypothetical protein
MDVTDRFRACVPRYLGRAWKPSDGSRASKLAACERRLGRPLPESLRAFYLALGEVAELLAAHNQVLPLEQLAVAGEYLLFMEENQSVVSWGIPIAQLHERDPIVWQRNNTPPVEWFSEDKGVLDLMSSMWDWYVEIGELDEL